GTVQSAWRGTSVAFVVFNAAVTTELYTLSLHDALPISRGNVYRRRHLHQLYGGQEQGGISTPSGHNMIFLFTSDRGREHGYQDRSEEHTSELQSRENLVCRLLLEKKKLNHPHNVTIVNS